ncbi:MAG: DEAD/DEAH box helicase [Elusimicrobia bacterium]|nr:DEAD/DEAH box helicase [Elusimicrobiota bacterium]
MQNFRNPFHPYAFLRFIYSKAPERHWLIICSHEFQCQDFLREIEALAKLFGLAVPRLAFLPDAEASARELALHQLAAGTVEGLTATPFGVAQPCVSLAARGQCEFEIRRDQIFARDDLSGRLAALGFKRVDSVESVGEFAVRGQVLDLFCSTLDLPVRLIFKGDQIESLRSFDIETQLTSQYLQSALVIGVAAGQGGFLADYYRGKKVQVAWEAEHLKTKDAPPWIGDMPGVFFSSLDAQAAALPVTPNAAYAGNLDLFARDALKLISEGYQIWIAAPTVGDEEHAKQVLEEKAQELKGFSAGESPLNPVVERGPASTRGEPSGLVLGSGGKGDSPALNPCQEFDLSRWRWVTAPIGSGFKDDQNRIWMVTTAELFSRVPVRITAPVRKSSGFKPKKSKESFQRSLFELKLGDFVVHEIYGIGRYRGLETVRDMEGLPRGEFLKLEYAKGDKLFVNPEDIGWLHKYVVLNNKHAPRLSGLDARGFEAVKNRVREEARQFCQELLAVWAKRAALPAPVLPGAPEWEESFKKSFPYEETQDQLKAIEEVSADLEKPRPMERLLLGDVGFGKTEVALRAALKTVASGRQVVVLTPTTVLADQHYRNFLSRLASYPFNIALFSRFSKKGEMKEDLKNLAKGALDVAIGTHRLLQKDVRFHQLGLLVVDEEHRFGVKDKERIKFISSQVHTLYMSATPIPRTLYKALVGLKGISVIETPPVGRLSIETAIGPWDPKVVERAIHYELGRGGQVFYVFNNIGHLPGLAAELGKLVPGIRTAVCHGQMAGPVIERTMERFLNREIDVLLASSIIESGLDIPTVNTLIVEGAENFGLAQLYQLRGRIGRKNVKAYAYFFYPRGREFNDLGSAAKERLKAIQEFAELGCGMRLAVRDLEIRGAGEILGLRQHGFVSKVGLELYSKLLEEEMAKLREGDEAMRRGGEGEIWPKIHLNFPAYFPESYLPSEMERVSYYRRLSRCQSQEEIDGIFTEIKDRAGNLPPEVINLHTLFKIRLLSRRLGLALVEETGQGRLRFEFQDKVKPQEKLIVKLLGNYQDRLQFEHRKQAFQLKLDGLSAHEAALGILTDLLHVS